MEPETASVDTVTWGAGPPRRRRRAWRIGAVGLVAAAAAGGLLLGGEDGPGAPGPAPAPQPALAMSPSPAPTGPLPHRAEPVEVVPRPYDRADAGRAHVLARLRNARGDPTLEWTVDRTADLTLVQASCRGAPRSRLVVSGGHGSGSRVPCDGHRGPGLRTMPFAHSLSPLAPEPGETLKAHVSEARSVPDRTSAAFELVVWGQDFRPVATLVGNEVSPLGEGAGRDWWFTRGVEAATGAELLTVELPASSVDRLAQTVTSYDRFPWEGEMPFVQVSLDGRDVDHRSDRPRIAFQDETSAFVPAGRPHTVQLRVTRGRPEHVDFALAVFEAGERR